MMLNKKNIILVLILVFAAFLRLWRLGDYPALNADEAAIGYNAYSLLETGMDEHSNPWPVHFQSFNDFKPGLYFYLVLPFVRFMDLNAWAVRLPNTLLSIFSVGLMYLLVTELFTNRVSKAKSKQQSHLIGLISAFMLAISPWHIHFSRGGWEVSTATFFVLLGVYLFIKGRRNLPILMLSVVSFSLSLYAYHAARVVAPLLGLGLIIIYWKDFKSKLLDLGIVFLLGLVLITPLARDFLRSDAASRAAGVGLFADPGPLSRINEQRGEHADFTGAMPKAFHNKAINYGLAFLENWSEHYHGEFLFLNGDVIERNRVPETGQMYLIDLLFLMAGAVGVIRLFGDKEADKKGLYFVILWLVAAPFAAALTFQSPHALRAQNMVIPLTIISAIGLYFLSVWLHQFMGIKPDNQNLLKLKTAGLKGRKKTVLNILFVVFTLAYAWQFSMYLHNYWVHLAKQNPYSSQYGVKELVDYVKENQDNYDKILVTDRYDQPYILFLFYLKHDPAWFQNNHMLSPRDSFGFSTVNSFYKYSFGSINWDVDQPKNPNSLIIGTPEEIPDEANIVKEIYGSNGHKYFEVVAN